MNTEPKPIYGEGNPETHPLTWRLSKQEHVRNADDYEALEGYAGLKKAITMPPKDVLEVIKAATVKGRGCVFLTGCLYCCFIVYIVISWCS